MEEHTDLPATLPVLPLRDIVVFPHMIVPLFVGRPPSVRALEAVMALEGSAQDAQAAAARTPADARRQVLLVAQKDPARDEVGPDDIYGIGTVAQVLQLLKLPDGTIKVLVEGQTRARITSLAAPADADADADADDSGGKDSGGKDSGFMTAEIAPVEETTEDAMRMAGLMRSVITQLETYAKLDKKIPSEAVGTIASLEDPSRLADTVSCHVNAKLSERQELLEMTSVAERLERVCVLMEGEIGILQVEKKVRHRVKRQMEKTQREYYLNEQLKAIQKELGEGGGGGKDDVSELEERMKKTKLSKQAREKAVSELRKLRQMSPASAEGTVVRNYLDWILSIPWGAKSRVKKDLRRAAEILDDDHYGLEKVKERILEYLAVLQRTNQLRGPILCLVGPPGVGKTSLGKSIARATGREFVRMSLGGVRDEAEIRGHRRTYIGSMPGRVIQSMKKVKHVNPLFLLDEIDKMGTDFRGDPSSALLEVLDPEQNNTFADHYLEVDYDLSKVMFITTANTLNIPLPLMDRMEIIRIAGYTEDEKVQIARRHLIPKTIKVHGLRRKEWEIDDGALLALIRTYTREAGVRNLERELNNLTRKAVKQILSGGEKRICVTTDNLGDFAGVMKFRYGEMEQEDQIGVVTGLAWTEVGGELLTIEAVMLPGKGKMIVTGNLRDVMKESISAANSYVKSRARHFGILADAFEKQDIHVHVPEGATPKDGPSAGVAMATAIVSVMTGIAVRRDVAVTGEITLRGRVLPIGGLKEKLLATLRAGMTKVLIPEDNAKDLAEIPDNVKNALEIVPVRDMDQVIKHMFSRPLPVAESWDEDRPVIPAPDTDAAAITAH